MSKGNVDCRVAFHLLGSCAHPQRSEAGRSENRERLHANLRVNLVQLHVALPARPNNHASLAPQIRAPESGFELSHG